MHIDINILTLQPLIALIFGILISDPAANSQLPGRGLSHSGRFGGLVAAPVQSPLEGRVKRKFVRQTICRGPPASGPASLCRTEKSFARALAKRYRFAA